MKDATHTPKLDQTVVGGLAVHRDAALSRVFGIEAVFSERAGGVSRPPYDALDLAGHVGDDPAAVDENRTRLLDAVGLFALRERLVTAEQVHGDRVVVVEERDAGAGAFASGGRSSLPACDALVTTVPGVPLMMLFADCVPLVLVAVGDSPGVAVVHAGWRGALAGIAGKAARVLCEVTGVPAPRLLAYIGPHIGPCCYQVGDERLSHFRSAFATITAAERGLDLASAIKEDLERAGVAPTRVAEVGLCTAHHVERFFSYRASAVTGRHAALGVIVKGD